MVWGPKAIAPSDSFICLVLLVVKVFNKVIWTWPGWVPSHKNLAVDRDVKHPIHLSHTQNHAKRSHQNEGGKKKRSHQNAIKFHISTFIENTL